MHDIRLVASFEISPASQISRLIERSACERLAEALAEDLARQAEAASDGLLVVSGSLFEPGELLRPGLPAWSALSDLARPVARQPSQAGQLLAIGAHQGRLPDRRLVPPDQAIGGQLLILPILLQLEAPLMNQLSDHLEQVLFERGGLHPPARASLAEATGLEVGHGQLMTLSDLIALVHVQMDTAGLGGFWPVVEHALIDPDQDRAFDLPASLQATWQAAAQRVLVDFESFDRWAGSLEDYALWTRAFRSLAALLAVHGMKTEIRSALTLDDQRHCLVESAGSSEQLAGLTEQVHPDCGLLCWTLIEDGRRYNLYPVDSAGITLVQRDFQQRGLSARRPPEGVQLDADGQHFSAMQ